MSTLTSSTNSVNWKKKISGLSFTSGLFHLSFSLLPGNHGRAGPSHERRREGNNYHQHTKNPNPIHSQKPKPKTQNPKMDNNYRRLKKNLVSFISSLSLNVGSGQTPDLPYYGCDDGTNRVRKPIFGSWFSPAAIPRSRIDFACHVGFLLCCCVARIASTVVAVVFSTPISTIALLCTDLYHFWVLGLGLWLCIEFGFLVCWWWLFPSLRLSWLGPTLPWLPSKREKLRWEKAEVKKRVEIFFFQLTSFVEDVKVDTWLIFSLGTGQIGLMLLYAGFAHIFIHLKKN